MNQSSSGSIRVLLLALYFPVTAAVMTEAAIYYQALYIRLLAEFTRP